MTDQENRRQQGFDQETIAANYLVEHGYQIIARNYYVRGAELDIIAMDGDILCFIEVRSRLNAKLGHPLETVSRAKQKNIIKAAKYYIMENQPECPLRFDVVGIVLNPYEITLVKDAFQTE